MELYLIRHGRTAFNRERVFRGRIDLPLDEGGRAEAEALARRLKGSGIQALYSSPLLRARQTAAVIAEALGLEVRIAPELIDLDFGLWQGLGVKEVQEAYSELYRKWIEAPHEVVFPQGEGLKDVEERVIPLVERLKQVHGEEKVALVSHRVVLKVLICRLLGLGLDAFWRVDQGTAALNRFHWDGRKWVAKAINDTCHLDSIEGAAVEF